MFQRSLAVAALAAAGLVAQTVDRTKEPQTPPIPGYKLPPVFDAKLPNGLEVVLVEDGRFPLVTARLNLQAGTKHDPKDMPGLAEAVAALLTEGTKTRTARQLSEETDALGGSLSGGAGADALTISGSALAENLTQLLVLMADVAMNATFPQDEVGPVQAEPHPEPAIAALAAILPGLRRRCRRWCTAHRRMRTSRPPRRLSRRLDLEGAGQFPRYLPGS